MKDFRRLQVWGKAHDLVLQVYKETQAFPQEEMLRADGAGKKGISLSSGQCGRRMRAEDRTGDWLGTFRSGWVRQ